MVVEDQDVLGSTLGLRDQQRGVVDVGDRDGLDARLDRRSGEAVVGEDELGPALPKHPLHPIWLVRMTRHASVGEHRDAVVVVDEPIVIETAVAPSLPSSEGEDLGTALAQLDRELVVQVREPRRMTGRQYQGLAPGAGLREPFARREARVDDGTGVDLDGTEPGVAIDRGAGGTFHEPEHAVERHPLLQPRQPERFVGIVREQHLDVPAHVVDRMGSRPRDAAGQERTFEVNPIDDAWDPVVVREGRQTADVGFDNVGRHWVSA